MPTVKASRTINAPRQEVFEVTAHIERYSQVVPAIIDVEFLSDQKTGAGTRFRETRQMGKRSASTVLEVTEYKRPEMVRIVSDEGGTIWDTVYTYESVAGGTDLTMTMDVRPYKLLAKLMTPFITRVVGKAVEGDMDAVKSYCEQS